MNKSLTKMDLMSISIFCLVDVPSTNTEEAEFRTNTATLHQREIEPLWLHFRGTVMSSIFMIYRL